MGTLVFFLFQNLGRAHHFVARSANVVRRCFRNADTANCNFCSIWLASRGSKLFTTSPVEGLVVAIAMLALSLRLVGYAPTLSGLKRRPSKRSGIVVEPQYYLTGRPSQDYTFKSRDLFKSFGSKGGREVRDRELFHPL